MDETKVTLRFPAELHAALVEMAKEEERSLNAQIVYLLRHGLTLRDPDPEAPGIRFRFDEKRMAFVVTWKGSKEEYASLMTDAFEEELRFLAENKQPDPDPET